jgi:hypothetical protein
MAKKKADECSGCMEVARLFHSVVAVTIIYLLPPPSPLLPCSGGGQ